MTTKTKPKAGKPAAKKSAANRSPGKRGTRSTGPAAPDPAAANVESSPGSAADETTVDRLLKSAEELHVQSVETGRKLLYQRVELGRILIRLKDAVGHGNFTSEFKRWVQAGKIGFSLKTGQRAMAYAELEAAGKFTDGDKNDTVSNLAEAERLRKAEAKKKEAEEGEEESSDGGADGEPGDALRVKLKKSQVAPRAKRLAKPLIEECRLYSQESRTELLEELIELLTEELEKPV